VSVDKGFKKETVTEKTTRLLSKIDEISEVSMYFIRAIYFDQEVIIDRRIVAGLRLDESAQEASR
jgi:hypothetical protein